MHQIMPSLTSYRSAFVEISDETQVLAESLSEGQFNRQPAPGKWSVGQCFQHLIQAGAPLAASMQNAIENAPSKRRVDQPVDIRHGLFGTLFIYALRPDTRIPMPAPPSYRPVNETVSCKQTTKRFLQLQDDLIRCIDQSIHLDVNRIRLSSPAFPFLYFRLGTWFEATIQHERRHIKQARKIQKAVGITH